jgi:hypothetical protein
MRTPEETDQILKDLERDLARIRGTMTVGAVLGAKEQPKKKWLSSLPTHCQICHNPLRDVFVDGATRFGPWAILCRKCHILRGCGTGTGRGQVYNLNTLEKIAG